MGATDIQIQEDVITELETELVEKPEYDPTSDQMEAPYILKSFESIPQTAFRPPDCTIAVRPQDVMVAVNTKNCCLLLIFRQCDHYMGFRNNV